MAECPYCKKPCVVPNNATWNAETYGQTVTSVTDCCGEIVNVHPVTTFRYTETNPEGKVDDWGRERKKRE